MKRPNKSKPVRPAAERRRSESLPSLEGRLTFRVREVVAATGYSQSTVYEMMDDGTLDNIKVGGIRLIYAESLRQLLNRPPPPRGSFPSPGRGVRRRSGRTSAQPSAISTP
jgi:excisionase family DNA binding protein